MTDLLPVPLSTEGEAPVGENHGVFEFGNFGPNQQIPDQDAAFNHDENDFANSFGQVSYQQPLQQQHPEQIDHFGRTTGQEVDVPQIFADDDKDVEMADNMAIRHIDQMLTTFCQQLKKSQAAFAKKKKAASTNSANEGPSWTMHEYDLEVTIKHGPLSLQTNVPVAYLSVRNDHDPIKTWEEFDTETLRRKLRNEDIAVLENQQLLQEQSSKYDEKSQTAMNLRYKYTLAKENLDRMEHKEKKTDTQIAQHLELLGKVLRGEADPPRMPRQKRSLSGDADQPSPHKKRRVQPAATCGICEQVANDGRALPNCGHGFCADCLSEKRNEAKLGNVAFVCPTCSSAVPADLDVLALPPAEPDISPAIHRNRSNSARYARTPKRRENHDPMRGFISSEPISEKRRNAVGRQPKYSRPKMNGTNKAKEQANKLRQQSRKQRGGRQGNRAIVKDGNFDVDDEGQLICDLCPARFPSKFSLNQHRSRVHNVGELVCDECSARYMTKGGLASHKARKHNQGKFVCPYCDTCRASQYQMNKHLEKCNAKF